MAFGDPILNPYDTLPDGAAESPCSWPDEYGKGPVPVGCVADLVTVTLANDYVVDHTDLRAVAELETQFQATTHQDYAHVYVMLSVDKAALTARMVGEIRVNGVALPLPLKIEATSGTAYIGPEMVVYTAVVSEPPLIPYLNTLQVFVSVEDAVLDEATILAPASRVTAMVFQGAD